MRVLYLLYFKFVSISNEHRHFSTPARGATAKTPSPTYYTIMRMFTFWILIFFMAPFPCLLLLFVALSNRAANYTGPSCHALRLNVNCIYCCPHVFFMLYVTYLELLDRQAIAGKYSENRRISSRKMTPRKLGHSRFRSLWCTRKTPAGVRRSNQRQG